MKHSRNHIIFRFIPFFFRFVQIDLRSGVLHAFFSRRQEKKVPPYNQSFFVISPVRSNPFPQFFTGSFAIDFGDHLRSRDHLRYCTGQLELITQFISSFQVELSILQQERSTWQKILSKKSVEQRTVHFGRSLKYSATTNFPLCLKQSKSIKFR